MIYTKRKINKDSPWPGLVSFTEDEHNFFHGREKESIDFTRLIKLYTLSILFGQSGLGKTSLLQAGIFPLLRQSAFLPVYIRIDFSETIKPLIEQASDTLFRECTRNEIEFQEKYTQESFWEYLHREDVKFVNYHGKEVTPVLIFDQLEELFTIGQHSDAVQKLVEDLSDLIENRIPLIFEESIQQAHDKLEQFDLERQSVKFVFSFREDYLPNFESLKVFIRDIMQNGYRLLPMNGSVAKKAILDSGSHLMEDVVAEKIVRVISETKKQSSLELEKLEVVPALMSVYCQGLNEERLKKDFEAKISLDDVSEMSREKILENFYHTALSGIEGRIDELIEEELIDGSGYRKSYPKSDATSEYGISQELIDELINRRLLQQMERYGAMQIELAHDVLTKTVKVSREKRKNELQIQERDKLIKSQRKRMILSFSIILILLSSLGYSIFLQFQQKQQEKELIQTNIRLKSEKYLSTARAIEVDKKNRELKQRKIFIEKQSMRLLATNIDLKIEILKAKKAKNDAMNAKQKVIMTSHTLEVTNQELNTTNINLKNAQKDLLVFSDRLQMIGHYFYQYALPDIEKNEIQKKISIDNKIKKDYTLLTLLILKTESMDDTERQYWLDTLPSMSSNQIERLYKILDTEQRKLEELESKYSKEIKQLNEKHLMDWNVFQIKDFYKKMEQHETASQETLDSVLKIVSDQVYRNQRSNEDVLSALKLAKIILQNVNPSDYKTRANCYHIIADFAKVTGDLNSSIYYFQKYIQLNENEYVKNQDKKYQQRIVDALGNLSFTYIKIHEYKLAYDKAVEALNISPDEVWIVTNRVHSLLFMGKFEEAKKDYVHFRYKSVNENQTFENAVINDFKEFRKYGLPEEPMRRIEGLYAGVSK
jgi:hypothetical protein